MCGSRQSLLRPLWRSPLRLRPPAAGGALRDGGARRLATKITIAVEDAGVRYRFTAAVLNTAPLQFEWFTTSPVAAEGVRVQS